MRLPKSDQAADGFRYAETHEAGVYLVRLLNQKPPKQMAFAVNIDPAESDPATLAGPELRARFGTRPLLLCESPEELAETIQRLREGTSLWEWFLAAVLIGLVLEVFLANRRSEGVAAQAGTATGSVRQQSSLPLLVLAPSSPSRPLRETMCAGSSRACSKMRRRPTCGGEG